jgi:RNA polymerase sigma-70 factor (ECF subfamily)
MGTAISQAIDLFSNDAADAADAGCGFDPRRIAEYRAQLLKYARWMLGNNAAAEDAVQETLLAALQSPSGFAGRSSVKTWLVGILKHKVYDTFQRQAREVSLQREDDDGGEAIDAWYDRVGHLKQPLQNWGDPEAALCQQRFFDVLESCIAQLPANSARVFTMRELLGMETEEICAALGITPNNCFVMLYRARMRLRALLQEHWFGESARARG